jgi:hypothetical protein
VGLGHLLDTRIFSWASSVLYLALLSASQKVGAAISLEVYFIGIAIAGGNSLS